MPLSPICSRCRRSKGRKAFGYNKFCEICKQKFTILYQLINPHFQIFENQMKNIFANYQRISYNIVSLPSTKHLFYHEKENKDRILRNIL